MCTGSFLTTFPIVAFINIKAEFCRCGLLEDLLKNKDESLEQSLADHWLERNQVKSSLRIGQRTLTVGGSSLHTNNIFSSWVMSSLVKLETGCTVILPPTLSVLWISDISVERFS